MTNTVRVDTLTGATIEVERTFAVPPDTLWARLGDVVATATRSPECHRAEWLDGATGPAVGARFRGHNADERGQTWTTTCLITVAEPPARFVWVVLNAAADPERFGSRWSYDLSPGAVPGQTVVRQTYEHGPGDSGFRAAVNAMPGVDVRGFRLEQLRRHMAITLDALARELAEAGPVG